MRFKLLCVSSILLALALSACQLEPTFVLQHPASADGTFVWLDALQDPSADYVPVTLNQPGAEQSLGVCRAIIAHDDIYRGYHTGEVRTAPNTNTSTCFVSHGAGVLVSDKAANMYQQLWVKRSASYKWVPLSDVGSERPLFMTRLWRQNRIPMELEIKTTVGKAVGLWHPCAIKLDHGWHIGKIAMHGLGGKELPCHIAVNSSEIDYTKHILVLYAPVDETE
jgi:hypothetical protein